MVPPSVDDFFFAAGAGWAAPSPAAAAVVEMPAIAFAGSQGQFELNAYMPVIAYNMLQSVRLLADAVRSFADNCIAGIRPREDNIAGNVEQSLMLVTALVPKIGYDAAAAIAKAAYDNGTTLREEAIASGKVTEEEFDALVDAKKMVGPL